MKLGIVTAPSQNATYHDLLDQVSLADRLGFHSVWLTEKHFENGHLLWSSPLITASYIAAKTQSIQIGFSACVSTLHHPVSLAEDFANLDVLSHGRLIIGLTRNSFSEKTHEVFQSPLKKTLKKFDEQFAVMQKLWLDQLNRHSGTFYKIPAVKLYPRLVQKPLPPIFFIVNNDESIIHAARKGVGIFLHAFQGITSIIRKKQLYLNHFQDILHLGPRIILSRFVYAGTNHLAALSDIADPFMRYIDEQMPGVKPLLMQEHKIPAADFDFLTKEICIFGDAADCSAKLQQINTETGITDYTFIFNLITLDHRLALESMQRFALNVLPQFRQNSSKISLKHSHHSLI